MENLDETDAEEIDLEMNSNGGHSVSELETEETNVETFAAGGANDAAALIPVGGFNRERPPQDDCCAICFDTFRFPCKTNCGHWYCSGCILRHWKYTADIKQCKCPMCGVRITKIVPLPSAAIQPGEDCEKILEGINRYNRLTDESLNVPSFIRRWIRQNLDATILRAIFQGLCLIGLLLALLYKLGAFGFFASGWLGIRKLFDCFALAVVLFILVDVAWYCWRLRRRARQLAQVAVEELHQPAAKQATFIRGGHRILIDFQVLELADSRT